MATNIELWVDYLTEVFQIDDHSRYTLESGSTDSLWSEWISSRSSSQTLVGNSSDGSLLDKEKETTPPPSPGRRKLIKDRKPRELELAKRHGRRRRPRIQEPYQQACLPPIEGLKLKLLVAVLCIGLLMSSLETTIIGTALISIGSDLGDFSKATWITTAYLITYTGFLIIFARCSDIFGRRSTFLVALIFFVAFSLACGFSQTMDQLIIFRAFQGIGGAGLNILAMGVATEVPGKARGPINGLLSAVFAISSAIGPLIGGAISSNASWRWVFLLKRVIGSAMLTSFLTGIPFFTIIIFLPERFQLENGLSPVDAGVRMLVYFVLSSWAAGLGAFICVAKNVMYQVIIFAIALQVLGLGLMSTLPVNEIPGKQYAFQVILAVNMGAITQVRILGGVIGIGIGDIILHGKVYSKLNTILTPQQIGALLTSTENLGTFAPNQINAVKRLYSDGFNFQFRIMMYIAIACFVVSLGTFVKRPIQVREIEAIEAREREEAEKAANEKARAAADAMIGVPPMVQTEVEWPSRVGRQ
ncbi:MAG: hypothetical protein Q9227_005098 [Pyrenula ochraceoflavens]